MFVLVFHHIFMGIWAKCSWSWLEYSEIDFTSKEVSLVHRLRHLWRFALLCFFFFISFKALEEPTEMVNFSFAEFNETVFTAFNSYVHFTHC